MKHKADIEIGRRCAEFVFSMSGKFLDNCKRLGIRHAQIYAWFNGDQAPCAHSIAILIANGANANYLFTGKQEIRHGNWNLSCGGLDWVECKCSECGYTDVFDDECFYNYCPECGAKMDGKENEE